ncbi:DUF3291 domain-containing protein [Aquiflexum lacus]|uniref:DUF3291 domain-containing protein n=1 Tax=Aquiflexum lacus TaxID=2483805 RepID=UPI001894D700|nr:DUF3291 domain-containing protein [Aquiflexum lacus]
MKVTITYLELKSPFLFFKLSKQALAITRQIKKSNCLGMRKKGVWTKHYTMTMWPDEKSLKEFSKSGAHFQSMKKSGQIAKEIKTLTIDSDKFPDWKTAKEILKNSKPLTFP